MPKSFLRKVGAMDDAGQCPEYAVVWAVLVDQRLEGAPSARILVGVPRSRSVEADRRTLPLDPGDFRRVDETEPGLRIDKAPDQPAGGRAIDSDVRSGDPEHGNRGLTVCRLSPAVIQLLYE